MPVAPLAKRLGVGFRHEIGADALIGFRDHARDILGIDLLLGQRCLKECEARVFAAESVGEGDVDDLRIEVLNPGLAGRRSAHLLGSHRPPMKRIDKRDDDALPVASPSQAVGAHQLQRAFRALGAGAQQEHLVVRLRRDRGQFLHELDPRLVGETVGRQERLVDLSADCLGDSRMAVPGVGDQDAAGEIEPLVAVGVEDAATFRAIPHDRRLAAHALRLGRAHPLDLVDRFLIWNHAAELAVPG